VKELHAVVTYHVLLMGMGWYPNIPQTFNTVSVGFEVFTVLKIQVTTMSQPRRPDLDLNMVIINYAMQYTGNQVMLVLVTTVWHVLRLQMDETTSRYEG